MTVETKLRDLDPARDIPDSLVSEPRARALLARLTADMELAPSRPRPRKTRTRVLTASLAIAATTAGAFVLVQSVGAPSAYASWTAKPRAATADETLTWGQQCVSMSRGGPRDYAVRLVEMRGKFAYTVLTAPDGFEATCLMADNGPGQPVTGGGFMGSLTAEPQPDGLATNSVRSVTNEGDDTEYEVTGKAGPEVAAVSFHVNGTEVHATLKDGYFAAWWPDLTSILPTWGPPNPDVTVTLQDGTRHTRAIQDYDVSPL